MYPGIKRASALLELKLKGCELMWALGIALMFLEGQNVLLIPNHLSRVLYLFQIGSHSKTQAGLERTAAVVTQPPKLGSQASEPPSPAGLGTSFSFSGVATEPGLVFAV